MKELIKELEAHFAKSHETLLRIKKRVATIGGDVHQLCYQEGVCDAIEAAIGIVRNRVAAEKEGDCRDVPV